MLLLSSSSSLLWSWWIPPSFFTDETPPRTPWCTPELPWREKKKKNSKKDWHVTLAKKEFRCCLWLWIWLRVCLFHYIFLLCFFHQKQNLQAQIDKKELFYSLKNDNLKHETIFVFVKFANCDNWIFSSESPVAKYVHFQAFTSCVILQNFNLSNVEPKKKKNKKKQKKKKPMNNKIDSNSNSSNLISGSSFCFLVFEKKFHSNTNKQTTKLVWYSWTINCVAVYKREKTKKTHFDGFDCVLLFVLYEGVFCFPLDWSGLLNRKAFRKLISVNRGERIHNLQ